MELADNVKSLRGAKSKGRLLTTTLDSLEFSTTPRIEIYNSLCPHNPNNMRVLEFPAIKYYTFYYPQLTPDPAKRGHILFKIKTSVVIYTVKDLAGTD
jgi:hypothetical protein